MNELIDVSLFGDALTVGTVGYVAGVLFPSPLGLLGTSWTV